MIELRAEASGGVAAQATQVRTDVRALADDQSLSGLNIHINGRQIHLSLLKEAPATAYETLSGLVSQFFDLALAQLRDKVDASLGELEGQLQTAEMKLGEAEMQLNEALAALPQGGEAAAGARLGQLQGDRDSLRLAIREGRQLEQSLARRDATLESDISHCDLGKPGTGRAGSG